MGKKYKSYTTKFKAKVALAALREDKTLSELSQIYQVPVNQISKWKSQAKEKMHQSFERSNAVDHEQREQQQLIDRLYRQIGKLQVEQDWLKKNFDL